MFNISTIHKLFFKKLILIFLFLLLTAALIITWDAPATGFESSIYWSTPLIFWISIISSVIIGIIIITLSISNPTQDNAYLRKIGLLLVFLCYTVTLGLFIIRGYFMWCMGGDPATHIGWINEILNTGHTPSSLIYPITHIYLSEISLITNLDLVFLHKIIPLIFALLCVVFIYILVKNLTSNKIAPVLAVIISCTMTYGWYLNLTPNHLSNLFFPLALFLTFQYLKQNKISWGILLITVIVLYPEFHPIPAVFLGIMFLSLWIIAETTSFWNIFRGNKIEHQHLTRPGYKLILPFLILLLSFVFWISSFSTWDYSIKNIYQTVRLEGGPSKITELVDQISYAQGYGYNVIEQILKQMGGAMILTILSVLCLMFLWKIFSENRENKTIFLLYGPFGLLCVFISALYVFNFTFGPLRLVIYISMLGTVFTAFFLSHLLLKAKKGNNLFKLRSVTAFTIIILTGLFFLGCLNLYPSPYNLTPNYQTPQSEISGIKYFFEYRNVSTPVSVISVPSRRFADVILTPEEKGVQHLFNTVQAPWHFGYDTSPSLSASYNKETNLIITQKDTVLYTDYFPNMAQYRFTSHDFKRLNLDLGINRLYSNGGFDLWDIIV